VNPCCEGHIPVGNRPGWCINSAFDGCEPCCENCPDYRWDVEPDEEEEVDVQDPQL